MKKLKRFSIFILVGILLFSLFFPACSTDNQSGNKSENISDSDTQSENSVDLEVAARRCYLEQFLLKEHSEATIEDVSFLFYIGTYGNCLVAIFSSGKWEEDVLDITTYYDLNGLRFEYAVDYPILVYCDQQIYTLQEAYVSELISAETLAQIHTDYYNP